LSIRQWSLQFTTDYNLAGISLKEISARLAFH
jgi:hypothetical protein